MRQSSAEDPPIYSRATMRSASARSRPGSFPIAAAPAWFTSPSRLSAGGRGAVGGTPGGDALGVCRRRRLVANLPAARLTEH